MKTSALLVKVLLSVALVVFLGQPAIGYEIQLDDFILGIEARPGYHTVKGVALSPDEERLYAAHWHSGTQQVQDPIGVYSTDDHSLIDQLLVGGCAGGVIVSDDDCCVYGTRYYGGQVHSYDVCDANTETIIDLGSWANMLWKTPDGNRAVVSYNASSGSPSNHQYLALIDISGGNCSMSVLDTMDLGGPGGDRSAAFLSDSSMMYFVVDSNTSEGAGLLEISLVGDSLVINRKIVLAGGASNSNQMAGVVLIGDTLYVGDHDGMKIHKVDRVSFLKTGEISLSYAPRNIALHPDGQHLFVLYGVECGGIAVWNLQLETEVGSVDCTQGLPQAPAYITFTSNGNKAYVSHSDLAPDEGGISVLSLSEDGLCDDFEDGVTDSSMWVTGGTKRGCGPPCASSTGSWNISHNEIIDPVDGYLNLHVWGPSSGNTYGAESWVRTSYDFNDGDSHTINFTWEANFNEGHYNLYFMQLTDGYISPENNLHWNLSPYPGTVNLLRDPDTGDIGWSIGTSPGKLNWSITIDPTGIARLYDAPNATGTLKYEGSLDSAYPWYIRFMVSDGTSAGFPAGDAWLNLYEFCTSDGDSDGDGVPDDVDNCPDVPNIDQTNKDNDSHGDACDNCLAVDNEEQADSDDDGVGNVCDNCWEIPNPDQSDSDGNCTPPYLEDPLCGDKCKTLDSDGDGITDTEDSCPDSTLDDTIVIDSCDSGVDNMLFENGCTMRDLIAECEDDAENHGKFVSCVAHLTNDWKKEGHISGKEKGTIQRCAAQSDIPSTTTTTIIPSDCTSDEECDDGLYCNGDEMCNVESGLCQAGAESCQDDGLYCNGEESCDEESDTCKHSANPCKPVLTCNEDNDVCTGCSQNADCDDELFCNGAETCDTVSTICQAGTNSCQEEELCIEETDACVPESEIPIIELMPDLAWRSSLIPLPLIMLINGNNTNFNATTTVDFIGDEVLPSWYMVLSPTSIFVLSLINPADSEDADSTEVIVTVISTVNTDEEVATAALTLNLIPGF